MSRPQILLPPGFGDSFWCLTKMESFIKKNGLERPEVYTWEGNRGAFVGGNPRTTGFLERYPFIEYRGGWLDQPHNDAHGTWTKFWSAPSHPENAQPKWLQRDYGFDHIMLLNGILEAGLTLDAPIDGLNTYETNWHPTEIVSTEETDYIKKCRGLWGKYAFAHFSGNAHYGHYYYDKVGFATISRFLCDIKNECTLDHIVVVGVSWDTESSNAICGCDKTGSLINVVNHTNVAQLMGLIRGSVGGIGTHSGCMMMPIIYEKPAIIFFTNRFPLWNPTFIKNHLPPESLERWYFPRYIEEFDQQREALIGLASQNMRVVKT